MLISSKMLGRQLTKPHCCIYSYWVQNIELIRKWRYNPPEESWEAVYDCSYPMCFYRNLTTSSFGLCCKVRGTRSGRYMDDLFPQKIVVGRFFLFYNAGDKPNPAERTSLPSICTYFVIFEKARMKLDPRSIESIPNRIIIHPQFWVLTQKTHYFKIHSRGIDTTLWFIEWGLNKYQHLM